MNILIKLLILLCVLFQYINATTPSLPLLSEEFFTVLEVTDATNNGTATMTEYWDQLNEQLRIEYHRVNHSRLAIYRFKEDLHVDISERGCRTFNVSESHNRRDSRFYDPNGHHMVSVRDMYRESKDYTYTYHGVDRVRGILSETWESDDKTQSFTTRTGHEYEFQFKIKWHWSIDGWSFRFDHKGRTPTRMELIGTFTNKSTTPYDVSNVHIYYDWINFEPTRPAQYHFYIPFWTFCPSLIEKPFPRIPMSFSARIEGTAQEERATWEVREFFDHDNHRSRVDTHYHNDHVTAIYRYDLERGYYIDWEKDYCHVVNSTTHPLRRGHIGRSLHRQTISLLNGYNYSYIYGGTTRARSIPCEQWQAHTVETTDKYGHDLTINWCFLDNINNGGWTVRGEHDSSRIPLRLQVNGTYYFHNDNNELVSHDIRHTYHYVDFTSFGGPDEFFQPPRHIFCAELVQKPMPVEIPNTYTANIEVNVPGMQTTYNLREYHDYRHNWVRLDTCREGKDTVELYDIGLGRHYTLEHHGDCVTRNISRRDDRWISYSESDHHLLQQRYDHADTAKYGGHRMVRGILAEHWRYNASWAGESGHVEYIADWFFMAESWNDCKMENHHTGQKYRKPILSVFNGTFTTSSNTKHPFVRENVYVGVDDSITDPRIFNVPAKCHGTYPPVVCSDISYSDCDRENRMPCGTSNLNNECGPCKFGYIGIPGGGNTYCRPRSGHHTEHPNLKPLPDIPDDFTVVIEANFVERDETIEIREAHDSVTNRIKIENHRHNHTRIDIYDYNRNTRHRIEGHECVTTPANKTQQFGPPSFYDPVTHHLKSFKELFYLEGVNYTYGGLDRVRGIECEHWLGFGHWTSRFDSRHGSRFAVWWCFAEPEWKFRGEGTHRHPVRMIVNGSRYFQPDDGPIQYSHPFMHYYEFIDFQGGRPNHMEFYLDHRMFCPALQDQPFPLNALIKPDFQQVIESNQPHDQMSSTQTDFFAESKRMARLDFFSKDQMETKILDYKRGVTWVITGTGNNQQCTAQELDNDDDDDDDVNEYGFAFGYDGTGHIRVKGQEWIQETTYGSKTYYRSIRCDRWRAKGVFENDKVIAHITGDYLYGDQEWSFHGTNHNKLPTPIAEVFHGRYTVKSTNQEHYFYIENNIVNYREGPIDPRHFEVPSVCHGKAGQCTKITRADCIELSRQPCGVVDKSNVCGPCLAEHSAKDPSKNKYGLTKCEPNVGSAVTVKEGVQTTVAVVGSVFIFLGGFGAGLLVWFLVNRARKGFHRFSATDEDFDNNGNLPNSEESMDMEMTGTNKDVTEGDNDDPDITIEL